MLRIAGPLLVCTLALANAPANAQAGATPATADNRESAHPATASEPRISWADLGAGTDTARALSASITRAGIWREVLEFVRLPLPLLRVRRERFFEP